MSVCRVGLAVASLSWASWTTAQSSLSICLNSPHFPMGHPCKLSGKLAQSRFYNRGMPASKNQAFVRGSRDSAERPGGRLVCFGCGSARQSELPTDVGPVLAISTGVEHTCTIRSDGHLVCCSRRNLSGQCDVPADLGPVLAVSAGGHHTCTVRSNGQLVCFGRNNYGQCDVPVDLGPVVAVSAGSYHTCAVRSDGQLVCFGRNDLGQCDVPMDLGPVLAVSAYSEHTCAVRSDGQLVCFQRNHGSHCCDVSTDMGPVLAVLAGMSRSCSARSSGQLLFSGEQNGCVWGRCDIWILGPVVAVFAHRFNTYVVRVI